MAQPASPFFPLSDNTILMIRELKRHVDTFSDHLHHALQDHPLHNKEKFLMDFTQNIQALNHLLRSLVFHEMDPTIRPNIEEIASILTHVLTTTSVDIGKGTTISLLDAIKNNSTTPIQESDLSSFLVALVQYPESSRILIQELHLISQDLSRYL